MKKHIINLLLVILFAAGLSLILYPSLSDRWNAFHQSRVIASYNDRVSELDEEQCSVILQKARDYNSRIAKAGIRFRLTKEEKAEYEAMLGTDSNIMGYIGIPRIGVYLPVYHGTSETALQTGAGHLRGTSLPAGAKSWTERKDGSKGAVTDPEDGSHCVLSGHRGLPGARLFTDLDRLVSGDTFTLTVMNETLTYEVDQIRTVKPEDMNSLELVRGEDLCTLVTCTPYGINTHRLLVRGHRIPRPADSEPVSADPSREIFCFVLPLIAAAVIFSLLVLMTLLLRGRMKNDSKKNDGSAGRSADSGTASRRRRTGSGGSAGP